MKKAVRKITRANMLKSPQTKAISSDLVRVFRLKATNIGIIGRMQGDSIEITPVKKEIKGRISI